MKIDYEFNRWGRRNGVFRKMCIEKKANGRGWGKREGWPFA